jgi:hypothetical protein
LLVAENTPIGGIAGRRVALMMGATTTNQWVKINLVNTNGERDEGNFQLWVVCAKFP